MCFAFKFSVEEATGLLALSLNLQAINSSLEVRMIGFNSVI